jgi:hypothetical protein
MEYNYRHYNTDAYNGCNKDIMEFTEIPRDDIQGAIKYAKSIGCRLICRTRQFGTKTGKWYFKCHVVKNWREDYEWIKGVLDENKSIKKYPRRDSFLIKFTEEEIEEYSRTY